MRIQDYFVDKTRRAADEAFRYAAATPAEKLDWSPMDMGRSVLDICRELAMTPKWAFDTIEGVESDYSENAMAELRKMQAAWTTVEACKAKWEEHAMDFYELVKNLPDSRLTETRWLPYEGGRDFTMIEMLEYASWNCNYHAGQIAYIQILLGDKEMH
ncbi:MAG: hypothetical protein BGO01_01295 [Armatimonadetes bacterium 55-13]|nr:hypothetical protein [Armatimonadota bacterium]OJU65585.1 MAG: hypothetical protein BGO01_01295 [Armatimonadetes bacterium 55-13]